MRPVYEGILLLLIMVAFHSISARGASGYGGPWDSSFCKGSCTLGQGDCDSDADCSGHLVCGVDNCRMFNSHAMIRSDCCIESEWDGQCVWVSRRPLMRDYNELTANTPTACIQLCTSKGFKYAGVQRGNQCVCGNKAPSSRKIRPLTECSSPCNGDTSKKCGGSWRMNVYTAEPKECYCGLTGLAKRKHTRIQGGEEAEVNEYPWQVLLHTALYGTCGGSLISDQWVLTAAHCVDRGTKESDVKVYLGEHDRTVTNEADTIQMNGVAEIIIHEKWDINIIRYDFALLRLASKINFGSHPHIRPICLPADGSNNDYTGYVATTTGWGKTSFNGNYPSSLQEVDLTVVTKSQCRRWWGTSVHIEQILCVEGDGTNGVCDGDSGGPLVTKENGDSGTRPGENYELIGVTSATGVGTCKDALPTFARVTAQLDWIREKTKDSWRTCPRT